MGLKGQIQSRGKCPCAGGVRATCAKRLLEQHGTDDVECLQVSEKPTTVLHNDQTRRGRSDHIAAPEVWEDFISESSVLPSVTPGQRSPCPGTAARRRPAADPRRYPAEPILPFPALHALCRSHPHLPPLPGRAPLYIAQVPAAGPSSSGPGATRWARTSSFCSSS